MPEAVGLDAFMDALYVLRTENTGGGGVDHTEHEKGWAGRRTWSWAISGRMKNS